jgi:O-antigen ligase
MPQYLKALVVILTMAYLTFWFAKAQACASGTGPRDFDRRRNLWFALTLTAFLAHNFWIYILVAGVLLYLAATSERNKLAMYYLVLFAVPPIGGEVWGFGLIRYFFNIDYFRLLALVVLLPAAVSLHGQAKLERLGRTVPDKLILGYLILLFLLNWTAGTLTNTLRHSAFYAVTDILLPYYVASRSVRTLARYRDAFMGLVVAALVLSTAAIFEFGRHWLLYANLDDALGAYWPWGTYLERTAGNLRAQASTGHPIVLGYVIAVAMGFSLYVGHYVRSVALRRVGLLVLAGGLVAALSRGPWLGAAVMVLMFIIVGPAPGRKLAKLALLGAVATPLVLFSPWGERALDYLPYIGTVQEENVVYRERLLAIAVQIILQNPFFGAADYFYSPAMQELKQGSGLIDIVNSYVAIGLSCGLVGLSLFVGFFASVIYGVWAAMARTKSKDEEDYLLGRALLATLVGILIIIITASSVLSVPIIYWTVAGLAVGYARMLAPAPAPHSAERALSHRAAIART